MKRRVSKQDSLTQYQASLNHAKKWRKDNGYDDLWRRMIDMYRGKHFDKATNGEDRIAINLTFSTVNVIFPSISVNNPKVTVQATNPDDDDKAIITEAVVNYWWRHHKFQEPFRLATKDFLTIGHGWCKVGYKFSEVESDLGEDEYLDELDEQRAAADAFAEAQPELAADLPTDEEIAASIPTTKLVVKEDRPFVERVSPFDMFVDPEATTLSDAMWVAHRNVRTLVEVKANKSYAAGARRRVKPDSGKRPEDRTEQEAKLDTNVDRVTCWEFYDLRRNTVCVFAEDGTYLIEPRKMPYAFGHPFVMLRNYDVTDEFYPLGDVEMLEPAQQELNKTRSQLMNHRKRNARKYVARAEAFGQHARAALTSDVDGEVVMLETDIPLQDAIMPLPQSSIAPELYAYSDMISGDMDKISGVNEYARGAMPEIRRTATEAAIIQDAANARAADKLATVERSVAEVAKRVVQLAQQYLTSEQVALVVGDNGAKLWVPYDFEDIQGEFDFAVEGGSTQPNNETFRRQQAISLMQALGPMIGQTIDPVAISKHVLQEGFGIKSPEKFMMTPPPMMPPGGDPSQMPPDPAMAGGAVPDGSMPAEGAGMDPMDPMGGLDAIPPELLMQLMAQAGLNPQTMGL